MMQLAIITESATRNQAGVGRFTAEVAGGATKQVSICRTLLGNYPLLQGVERQAEDAKIKGQTVRHCGRQRVGTQENPNWSLGFS